MHKAAMRATVGGLKFARLMSAAAPLILAMATPTEDQIAQLEQERDALLAEAEAIKDSVDDPSELTDEQVDEINAKTALIENKNNRITALKGLQPKGVGPKTARETNKDKDKPERVTQPGVRDNGKHNFRSLGEFVMATHMHARNRQDEEPVKKLRNAATTYGNEGVGTDGGFLVPPDFSREIWKKVEAEENLMLRCAELTPTGNSMNIPKDETTPWGTAGMRVFWEGEASQATQSRQTFEHSQFRLFKLMGLVNATDELIEDAPGYESYIMAKMPGIMSHTINDKIIDGTGVGMPLGILKAPSLISVAKETSQPADTIWFGNIQKMWGRMYAPWRRNAVWLMNQDVEAFLEMMAFQPSGAASQLPTAASTPVYLPPGGLSDAPYGRLKGRPVIPLQACKTIGDQGDILLVDLKQYWAMRKQAGPKQDTSIHLYFDQAVTAFRFIFRMNGQPAWSSAITPQNGSNTLSWAVALDAR